MDAAVVRDAVGQAVDDFGGVTAVAAAAGVDRGVVARILSGKVRTVTETNWRALQRVVKRYLPKGFYDGCGGFPTEAFSGMMAAGDRASAAVWKFVGSVGEAVTPESDGGVRITAAEWDEILERLLRLQSHVGKATEFCMAKRTAARDSEGCGSGRRCG